ncbi:hypothetical protein B0H14DRAFT_2605039 [Mycena olivaceomarginata]|nr:hypothetical protein B0H14DRAFT_2605039 [Mycena olivaceomarginata]
MQALHIPVLTLFEFFGFSPFDFPARKQRLAVDRTALVGVNVYDQITSNKIIDTWPVAGIRIRATHAERTRSILRPSQMGRNNRKERPTGETVGVERKEQMTLAPKRY